MSINNIKILIVFTALNSFLFSITSNISGILFNYETNEPINNANIYIEKYEIGTTSNQNGYFFLTVDNVQDKSITLNIKIIGYKEKIILVELLDEEIDLGKIFINRKPIELETLHIHSHQSELSQISDKTISGSELSQNLKSNIASTLSNYPNIGINSFGSVTSKPALRGFSGDRFLLTKDGDETGDLAQSSIDHVITLDMSEVSRIEIIRGPKSLVFGANAIGGVVNTSLIGSPNFRAHKIYQRYLIGGESFNNNMYGNFAFYIPIKNNQINLFVSDKNTKNEITPIGELDNTESYIQNYKIRLTNYGKNGYLSYALEDFNMGYGIPPNMEGHIMGVDVLLNKKSQQINYHQDILFNSFTQIDIKYNLIEYIHLELVNDSVLDDDIFQIFDDEDYHLALQKKTHDFEIELSSDKAIIGLEYSRKNFTPSGFYLTPETMESYLSIYGYGEQNFLDLDFLSSFRLGYLNVDPKLNGVQYINLNVNDVKEREFKTASLSFGFRKEVNKFELNSWVMHTMRAPRVEELYSDGPHLGTYSYEIGNPNLESEKIYGIENSVSFNGNPFKLSLTTFYNYSPYYYEMAKMGNCQEALDWDPMSGTSHPCAGADFIDWGSGSVGWLYKYNARGIEATIQGLELDLGYKLGEFELSYNFSFVQGHNKTVDRPLSYINPMKQILNLDYNKNNMNYKVRFSKIHAQDKLGEFETYTPGAFLTDFIISYNYKSYNVVMQLNNIFDNTYYNHLSRIKNITPEPGRNIVILYKMHF
tara:strand:+ start:129 stop:2414 length:2286 start_codon:yes stop_codon:yes gene_type:complete